jgi:hypothetical protein
MPGSKASPPRLPPQPKSCAAPPVPGDETVASRRRRLRLALLGAGIGLAASMVVALAVMLSVRLSKRRIASRIPEVARASVALDGSVTPVPRSLPQKPPLLPKPEKSAPRPPSGLAGLHGSKSSADRPARKAEPEEGPPEPLPVEKPPPEPKEKGPLADVQRQKGLLPLPLPNMAGSMRDDRACQLAKIPVPSADCQLSLEAGENVLAAKDKLEIKPADQSDGSRVWSVQTRPIGLGAGLPIGKFALRDRSLTFHWDANLREPQYVHALLLHLLSITAGGETESCVLLRPLEVEVNTNDYKWDSGAFRILLMDAATATMAAVVEEQSLRLDVCLQGMPKHEVDAAGGLKVNDCAIARFHVAGKERACILELALTFARYDDGAVKKPGLAVRLIAHRPAGNATEPLSKKTLTEEKKKYSRNMEAKLVNDNRTATRKVKEDEEKSKVQIGREWYDKMEKIVKEIQKGRIEYRIYTVIKGKEVVLVRSKGFTRQDSPAADAESQAVEPGSGRAATTTGTLSLRGSHVQEPAVAVRETHHGRISRDR